MVHYHCTRYVVQLRENTPEDYPKQWSGFAVTIGQNTLYMYITLSIVWSLTYSCSALCPVYSVYSAQLCPGSVMSEQLNVPHTAWQKALTGLSRYIAAVVLQFCSDIILQCCSSVML